MKANNYDDRHIIECEIIGIKIYKAFKNSLGKVEYKSTNRAVLQSKARS